jgi:hypothetical protein
VRGDRKRGKEIGGREREIEKEETFPLTNTKHTQPTEERNRNKKQGSS